MREYAINVAGIPAELRALPRWVTWRSVLKRGAKKPTKVPYRVDGLEARSNDPQTWGTFDDVLRAALERQEDDGIGFMFLRDGGFAGVDLDGVIDEHGNLEPFAQDIIDTLDSYTEISPRGRGVHILVRGSLPTGGRRKDQWTRDDGRELGIEAYDFGRYFTVTGNHYLGRKTIEDRKSALATFHAKYLSPAACVARKTSKDTKKLSRHDAIVTQTVRLRKSAVAPSEILAQAHALNGSFAEPKPPDEVAKIVEWAADRVEPDSPEMIGLRKLVEDGNDAANGVYFATRCRGRLVFNHTDRAWQVFDGRRWAKDETGGVMRFAKATAREILQLAAKVEFEEFQRKALDYARKLGGRRSLEAMIELAKSELPATAQEFDVDRFAFNVLNGTIDLRTGNLRPHDPQDLLTKLSPVAYDPNATAERWPRFLDEIFQGRQELIDYLQCLVGYMLTGDVSEHALPIAYGTGANGKSVLVGLLEKLLGDYALHADVALLLARRETGATPELARLKGARLVAVSEMPEGGRLSENLVKTLTGGDQITARHLYGEFFQFTPTAKYIVATNYKPIVKGDDDGIWRRLKLLPFEAKFDGPNRDRNLSATLEAELPGILRWAVEGCLRWQSEGLNDPKPVVAAMAQYRSDSDAIGAFLGDRCVERSGCEVRATALSAAYKAWCETSSERVIPARAFRAKIRERGFGERKSHGEVTFQGLGLQDDTREASAA